MSVLLSLLHACNAAVPDCLEGQCQATNDETSLVQMDTNITLGAERGGAYRGDCETIAPPEKALKNPTICDGGLRGEGVQCKFPFVWREKTYYKCTDVDTVKNEGKWCATLEGGYGFCEPDNPECNGDHLGSKCKTKDIPKDHEKTMCDKGLAGEKNVCVFPFTWVDNQGVTQTYDTCTQDFSLCGAWCKVQEGNAGYGFCGSDPRCTDPNAA